MNYEQRIRNRLAQFPTADVRADCADIAAEADAELSALRAELAAAKAENNIFSACFRTQNKCIADQDDELTALKGELAAVKRDAHALALAAVAYDKAIQACANSPDTMSSYCTAEGDDLDTLYARFIDAAREALKP